MEQFSGISAVIVKKRKKKTPLQFRFASPSRGCVASYAICSRPFRYDYVPEFSFRLAGGTSASRRQAETKDKGRQDGILVQREVPLAPWTIIGGISNMING